jgi:hypothetical protein
LTLNKFFFFKKSVFAEFYQFLYIKKSQIEFKKFIQLNKSRTIYTTKKIIKLDLYSIKINKLNI